MTTENELIELNDEDSASFKKVLESLIKNLIPKAFHEVYCVSCECLHEIEYSISFNHFSSIRGIVVHNYSGWITTFISNDFEDLHTRLQNAMSQPLERMLSDKPDEE